MSYARVDPEIATEDDVTGAKDGVSIVKQIVPSVEQVVVETPRQQARRRLFGLTLMAISAFMFSIMSLCAHVLSRRLGPFEIGVYRFLVQGVICACVMMRGGVVWWPTIPKARYLLVARGLFGTAGMLCYFYALANMTLSDATIIVFTNPIITTILGAILLKEGWTVLDAIASLLCFIGVIFVARPAFMFGHPSATSTDTNTNTSTTTDTKHHNNDTLPTIIACTGAFVSSCGFIVIRQLGKMVDANTVVLWYSFSGVLFSLILTLALEHFIWSLTALEWGMIVICGVTAYAGQWMMSKGLQLEKAGPAIMMRYLDIVFSFLWQVLLLHDSLNAWSIGGAVLVTSCAFVNPLKQWLAARKAEANAPTTSKGHMQAIVHSGDSDSEELVSPVSRQTSPGGFTSEVDHDNSTSASLELMPLTSYDQLSSAVTCRDETDKRPSVSVDVLNSDPNDEEIDENAHIDDQTPLNASA